MKRWIEIRIFAALLLVTAGLGMTGGCDSGEKLTDEVTGNRALKQYQKSKKDIQEIAERQSERVQEILDQEEGGDKGS